MSRPGPVALLIVGSLLLVVVALADLAGQVPGNSDDAFIVLVYARHLSEGAGFVYNRGEGALDGFTSMLDVLVKAVALSWWTADGLRVSYAIALGAYVGSVLMAIALAARIARQAQASAGGSTPGWTAAAGALVLALTPGLSEGTSYLLETPLVGLLLFAVLFVYVAPRPSLAALVGLGGGLVLVRPEGTPLALFFVASGAAGRARSPGGRGGSGARRFAAPLAMLAFVVLYYGWRIVTFGDWAPNSYSAKTSARRIFEVRDGARYVFAAAGSPACVAQLVFTLLAPLLWRGAQWSSSAARSRFGGLLGATLVAFVTVVVSGGDCYPGARFLVLPLGLAGTTLLYGLVHVRAPAALRAILWLLLGVAGAGALARALPDARAKLAGLVLPAPRDADLECLGQATARLASALDSTGSGRLAHYHFQRFKYLQGEVRVFDMSGINERDVARLPVDGPVAFGKDGLALALERGVEVIHFDYRWGHPQALAGHAARELVIDPTLRERFALPGGRVGARLAAEYAPASLGGVCGDLYLNVFVRREWVDAFRDAGFEVR